jgi:hypothetical protein
MKTAPNTIRQGDVLLTPVASLPAGCQAVPLDKGRIVLAYGEVTGHAHAIADHGQTTAKITQQAALNVAEKHRAAGRAVEIADRAIQRARARAKLWRAPDGARYLEVREPVSLTHEEHTAHTLPPGIYRLPTQVEYVARELARQVAD